MMGMENSENIPNYYLNNTNSFGNGQIHALGTLAENASAPTTTNTSFSFGNQNHFVAEGKNNNAMESKANGSKKVPFKESTVGNYTQPTFGGKSGATVADQKPQAGPKKLHRSKTLSSIDVRALPPPPPPPPVLSPPIQRTVPFKKVLNFPPPPPPPMIHSPLIHAKSQPLSQTPKPSQVELTHRTFESHVMEKINTIQEELEWLTHDTCNRESVDRVKSLVDELWFLYDDLDKKGLLLIFEQRAQFTQQQQQQQQQQMLQIQQPQFIAQIQPPEPQPQSPKPKYQKRDADTLPEIVEEEFELPPGPPMAPAFGDMSSSEILFAASPVLRCAPKVKSEPLLPTNKKQFKMEVLLPEEQDLPFAESPRQPPRKAAKTKPSSSVESIIVESKPVKTRAAKSQSQQQQLQQTPCPEPPAINESSSLPPLPDTANPPQQRNKELSVPQSTIVTRSRSASLSAAQPPSTIANLTTPVSQQAPAQQSAMHTPATAPPASTLSSATSTASKQRPTPKVKHSEFPKSQEQNHANRSRYEKLLAVNVLPKGQVFRARTRSLKLDEAGQVIGKEDIGIMLYLVIPDEQASAKPSKRSVAKLSKKAASFYHDSNGHSTHAPTPLDFSRPKMKLIGLSEYALEMMIQIPIDDVFSCESTGRIVTVRGRLLDDVDKNVDGVRSWTFTAATANLKWFVDTVLAAKSS